MASTSKYNKLAGKSILVIGGTSGIGFCVAEGCVEHGARVVVTGSSAGTVDNAIERIRAAYPSSADHITGFPCDLADTAKVEASVEELLQKAIAWAGGDADGEGSKKKKKKKTKLDHIAFLAGDAAPASAITEMNPTADLPPLMAVRIHGVLAVAKLAPRYLEVSAASSLTITAGAIPDKPMQGRSLIAAVGGAIITLGRSLAVDLQPTRVNVVSPGLVHTERFERVAPGDQLGPFLEFAQKNTLVKEVGRPEDVAEAYLYAMKDRFITGEHIRSNGGLFLV